MKSFDVLPETDIQTYEGRHDDLILQAPAMYRLLVMVLDDTLLPHRLRPLVLATVAYFILPAGIIPEDMYGPYGYVGDIFLVALMADWVRQEIGSDDILVGNWNGEAPILSLIQDILAREQELIVDKRERLLECIGYEYLVKRLSNS